MRFALILLLASTAISFAQKSDDKERLIFQPGAKEPNAPAPAASPTPRKLDAPAEKLDLFFLALKAGQVDAAYDALVADTIIAERKEDVTGLKLRTKEAIESYGAVSGYEVVDEKVVGTSLLRRTAISLNADLPLRWRFYFYRSEGAWRLVDIRIDDALVELFEEAGRARK
ncbi:MAG: hypothetical protein ACOYMS_11975 [Terrimicrobiaceae bacterium]